MTPAKTSPGPVELAETCRCGASTNVKVSTVRTARRLVEDWRSVHRCDPLDERDRGRTGAGTALPGRGSSPRIGFGAAPEYRGPWRGSGWGDDAAETTNGDPR